LSERTGSVQKEQRDEVSEDEEVLLGDTTVQDEEALFGDTTVEDEDDEDPGGAEIASSVDGHYALLAVVCHQGPSASHGHYVCDVWNAQKVSTISTCCNKSRTDCTARPGQRERF